MMEYLGGLVFYRLVLLPSRYVQTVITDQQIDCCVNRSRPASVRSVRVLKRNRLQWRIQDLPDGAGEGAPTPEFGTNSIIWYDFPPKTA